MPDTPEQVGWMPDADWQMAAQQFGYPPDITPSDIKYWDGGVKLAEVHARARELRQIRGDATGWRPVETFDKSGQAHSVIVAVTDANRPGIVGEAWRHENGEWWWAGTAPGDYYDNPISQIQYGRVTHWMPLPPPPSGDPKCPKK